jgi:hypothetical protein
MEYWVEKREEYEIQVTVHGFSSFKPIIPSLHYSSIPIAKRSGAKFCRELGKAGIMIDIAESDALKRSA